MHIFLIDSLSKIQNNNVFNDKHAYRFNSIGEYYHMQQL